MYGGWKAVSAFIIICSAHVHWFVLQLKLISIQSIYCFDDEVISLLDLGVEKPREAMMLRAPETEALYEGSAQKGFGVSTLDGSPMPLGSTATHEPIEIPRSLWGRWKSLDATGLKTLWIKKQNNPKQININDNQ
jgi:hypothetical protein